jgi:hypothetical protein
MLKDFDTYYHIALSKKKILYLVISQWSDGKNACFIDLQE